MDLLAFMARPAKETMDGMEGEMATNRRVTVGVIHGCIAETPKCVEG